MCVFTTKVTLEHTQAGAEEHIFLTSHVTWRTHSFGRAVTLHADGTVSLVTPVGVFTLNLQSFAKEAVNLHTGTATQGTLHLTAKSECKCMEWKLAKLFRKPRSSWFKLMDERKRMSVHRPCPSEGYAFSPSLEGSSSRCFRWSSRSGYPTFSQAVGTPLCLCVTSQLCLYMCVCVVVVR